MEKPPILSVGQKDITMEWNKRDQSAIWHLNTLQQLDHSNINIVKAEGAYLWDEEGKKYIDAIASKGVNLHGHQQELIQQGIKKQLEDYGQIYFTGFTHPIAIELAEEVLNILPDNQVKIIFSENSNQAIETALKLCIQYWQQQGKNKKNFITFEGGFLIESLQFGGGEQIAGASSVNFHNIPLPVDGENTQEILDQITRLHQEVDIAGFIFEPLIQSRAGMLMYAAEDLERIIKHCQQLDIICIADERFTAFGRTGAMLACDHMEVAPDIFCLSDNLTAGYLPLGMTSCTSKIYHAFLSKEKKTTFDFHSSYEANPLACAAALASLEIFKQENYIDEIVRIVFKHLAVYEYLKDNPHVKNVRQLGTILAFDLVMDEDSIELSAFNHFIAQTFIQQGVIIHPMGTTIYISPPFCMTNEDLDYIYSSVFKVIKSLQ